MYENICKVQVWNVKKKILLILFHAVLQKNKSRTTESPCQSSQLPKKLKFQTRHHLRTYFAYPEEQEI